MTVDHKIMNPCTNAQLRLEGAAYATGRYWEVDEGYRFRGQVDYGKLTAHALDGQQTWNPMRSEEDSVKMTVDVPFERTFVHHVVFGGPGQQFKVALTWEFGVGWFGQKDIELKNIETTCMY